MLTKLNIPAGVYRNNTPYAAGPRWYDTNLVRWFGEAIGPVGGWERMTDTTLTGACRGLFAWLDNAENRYLAAGTSENLYVYTDGSLYNISPVDLVPGRDSTIYGYGYGAGAYGGEAYGTARALPSSLVLQSTTWTFDAFGELLIACSTADGRVLEWGLNTSSDATVTTNAPVDNTGILVTEQRHLMAYGVGGDKRAIAWSDSEDRNDWTPSAANQAGDWNLNSAGEIRCALKTRGEILFLTSADAHVCRFVNVPLVFSFERVGQGCGVISPNAAVGIEAGVVWMGADARFYMYDGAVRDVPCEVQDWVNTTLAKLGGTDVYAGSLSEQGEIWWFFPSVNGETNDKYVCWNYKANHWSIGSLDRTAWLDRGAWKYPVAVAGDYYIYQHEIGTTDSGDTRNGSIYAETGAIEIGSGDRFAHVLQVLPDENTQGQVSVTFKTKSTPTGTETTFGPYTVRADGYTDVRFSGRQVKYRIDQVEDSDWRVGNFRAEVIPGEKR